MIAAYLLLLVPVVGMLLLSWVNDSHKAGRINIRFNAVALFASVWLAVDVLLEGPILSPTQMLYIDSFNVYLIALTAFVGLTTSIFSGPYMAHEQELGKVGKNRLRLYYTMYQGFMLAMYLVLTTNNMGVMWVLSFGF